MLDDQDNSACEVVASDAHESDIALNVTGDGIETESPTGEGTNKPDAEEETEEADPALGEEESDEDDEAYDYEQLQEDEETRTYMPLWMRERLDDPPIWPGASKTDLLNFFRSYEYDYRPPHRPKSDVEYEWVWQASKAAFNLIWLERLETTILANQRRAAVESLQMQAFAAVPSSKEAKRELECSAKEAAMDYFADPDYRKKIDANFANAGFGAHAVAGEAFVRALPSLKEIARMKKEAMKQRDDALKQLDRAYDQRDPEQQMPLSSSAISNFFREVQEDTELGRQEREQEKIKKAAGHGDAEADRSK
ncbi:hypothetical protein [Bradyrhizobium sp. 62]|uniref:hypothetical protein n=1 Tax=Bradyrhizobium sp. 62 TaxID=1043588 RepID=UPI001FFACC13|nr:hypothetical protein [Bradyrhizobium sp. 62]MCK1368292.1 hypothetical protein [Bradyrhizobium sp. 62]